MLGICVIIISWIIFSGAALGVAEGCCGCFCIVSCEFGGKSDGVEIAGLGIVGGRFGVWAPIVDVGFLLRNI